MFKEERNTNLFEWSFIGDIETGRPRLGPMMPVSVYRLMLYTLRDEMIKRVGIDETNKTIIAAGEVAGRTFCNTMLDKTQPLDKFISNLQQLLIELKIGIVRIESINEEKYEIYLTVEDDLDCSGLPVSDETVCDYDEGFLAGIFSDYSGKKFIVKEIDCWASGARVCRFKAEIAE